MRDEDMSLGSEHFVTRAPDCSRDTHHTMYVDHSNEEDCPVRGSLCSYITRQFPVLPLAYPLYYPSSRRRRSGFYPVEGRRSGFPNFVSRRTLGRRAPHVAVRFFRLADLALFRARNMMMKRRKDEDKKPVEQEVAELQR